METIRGTYSIKELQGLTGVSVRTIRFYIKEGVVSPAVSYAKFSERHLLELQLIKILNKRGLKLINIKTALKGKTEEEIRSILANAETDTNSWDTASLGGFVSHKSETAYSSPPSNFSFAAIGTSMAPQQQPTANIINRLTSSPVQEPEAWDRLRPLDGVEINLRSNVDQKTRELVMQLMQQLVTFR